MCGIVGYWDKKGANLDTASLMSKQIQHRGPDDSGTWLGDDKKLAFAHQRLSILDLSPAGHQPMTSPCGRYTLVYNGEIYNHLKIRGQLAESSGQPIEWRGHSDSETLLAALRHWGIAKTLEQVNGMFAFALWDSSEQTLFLARDRMGEKPLYYGVNNGVFFFGSELSSFKPNPSWNANVDRDSLTLYMRHNYVPAPWSIYKGINKLLPAHYVVIRDAGQSISELKCYWDLKNIAESSHRGADVSSADLVEDLDSLLKDAVKMRMASDVPLGAFLSGGFDSSLVVALMQAQSNKPIKTFTIGFHNKNYNEAVHAKAVAKHLGTDHTELYINPDDALAVIPKLPEYWNEPFSDSSQIPTFLVSKLAREHVTVSLSGDGGDELFCGYTRYTQGYQGWQKLRLFPGPIRKVLAYLIQVIPGAPLEYLMQLLPKRFQIPHLADRLPKLADVVKLGGGDKYYHTLVSHWKEPEKIVIGGIEPQTIFSKPGMQPNLEDLRERMMYIDSKTYLPDDILTKVDRASMAVSLEARVPLLDHRVVEASWKMPVSLKYKDGKSKWPLREVLYRYVPRELMERPKMGFGVPIGEWLRGPLREWAEELLDEKRLREEGYFDPVPIRNMWQEHISGKRRWHSCLWSVLMFQAWLEEQL